MGKRYSAKLKFQVVMELLTGNKSAAQVAKVYGILCWLLNSSMRILRANIGIIKYHVAQSTIHLELFAI
jgi:transposase-like protein